MGVHLYITRAEFWANNESARIEADEWLRVVAADAELTLEPENGPHFAAWHSAAAVRPGWVDWSEGNLYSKYPDDALIAKMGRIAAALDARLQHEDGDPYEGERAAPRPPSLGDRLR